MFDIQDTVVFLFDLESGWLQAIDTRRTVRVGDGEHGIKAVEDYTKAIEGCKRVLELAPDAPIRENLEGLIEQLQDQQ